MNRLLVPAAALLLAACATPPPNIDKAAVEDFIMVANLEAADKIRTDTHDRFKHLNHWYVVYKARHDSYLIQFARRCAELDTNRITADRRWDETIRPGQDTLRGCRIEKAYLITDEQAEELRRLSDAPGRGNK